MPRRVEALVDPHLLTWARNSAGLEIAVAAGKAQLRAELLERWEQGEGRPSIPQLRKLGKVYKRPIAVFYLPEPPTDFQALRDFRRVPGVVAGTESPELRFQVRQLLSRREFAIELYEATEGPPPQFELSAVMSENPDEVADRLRAFLGITREGQTQWRPGYESLNEWRAAFEKAGVLVFQMADVEISEARGFSAYGEQFPAVVMNIKDSASGRIFTMLHELTHLALHEGGLCDLSEESGRPAHEQQLETYCNRVAGAALVPEAHLLAENIVAANSGRPDWTDAEIRALADRFGCSREVVLRRLLICGRTTEEFYQVKRRHLLEELKGEEARRAGGFAPPYRMVVSGAGPFFVRLVLNNYYQGNITASDVSEFLGARLKHLRKIETAMLTTPG